MSSQEGARVARAVQRDRLATRSLTFNYSFAQAAAFWTWWRTTLVYGGAWFEVTDWPLPQGGVSVVRFLGVPTRQVLPGFGWQLSAAVEVRGAGVLPVPPDRYWADVVLLMGFENGAGSTFVDESPVVQTVTRSGTAVISASSPLVGSGSLALDGSGTHLIVAANSHFGFGTGPWTCEARIRLVALSGSNSNNAPIYEFRSTQFQDGAMFIRGGAGTLQYWNGSTSTDNGTGAVLVPGTTYDVAMTYDGTKLRGFVDGVKQFEVTRAIDMGASRGLFIGCNYDTSDSSDQTHATFDELRITRACRYTADYTPETGAFERRG